MFSLRVLRNRTVQRQCFLMSNRMLSSEASFVSPELKIFRTDENDPSKHGNLDHGLFYTIPQDVVNKLFVLGGFDKEQRTMMKTFGETALIVREPALNIFEQLKNEENLIVPKRFVLHGRIGSGKTFVMNHLLHYGYANKYILLYCGIPTHWTRFPEEYSFSIRNPKRVEMPMEAAVWLQLFKAQNYKLLEELQLKTSGKYEWSSREITNPGDTILSIVEHGINRIKHASDCVAVILKELRLNANAGNCKLMVAIEKVNAFYEPSTLLYPDRIYVDVDDITLVRAFKKFITDKDWKNGVVVTSVDKKLVVPYRILPIQGSKKVNPNDRTYKHWGPFSVKDVSDLPKDLLGEQGMTDFEPFQSIPVEGFSDKELMSCLYYYQDRNWIQHPQGKSKEGRAEIGFLSGNNPGQVYYICSSL